MSIIPDIATASHGFGENVEVPGGGSKPGERRGGRKVGTPNKATAEAKRSLEELARTHTEAAMLALVKVATNGESEAARVSAAVAILDRGYGKPKQALEHSGQDGEPVQHTIEVIYRKPKP